MCVNNLFKVALDSVAAGIGPAISGRKSNALTTTPPSHFNLLTHICKRLLTERLTERVVFKQPLKSHIFLQLAFNP